VDEVHGQLRDSIVSGRLVPGTRLIEKQLADELGVSRGTVRSALRLLAAEGLVDEAPHKGSTVREISIDELVDVFNARVGIETSAIRLCAKQQVPTGPLRAEIAAMEAAVEADDVASLTQHEYLFHARLCELSGNRFIVELFRSLAAQIRIAIGRDTEFTDNLEAAPGAHVPLVEAIEAGDEGLAAELLAHHMNATVVDFIETSALKLVRTRVLTPTELHAPPDVLRRVSGLGEGSGETPSDPIRSENKEEK
jgi:DNA-binding GntR family transcriptional regulator